MIEKHRGDLVMGLKCPVCLDNRCYEAACLYDDRFGYPGSFVIAKCPLCGHGHLANEFDQSGLNKLYSDYYPSIAYDVKQHRPLKEERGITAWLDGVDWAACRWVPENVRVLDIGCGDCRALGYYVSRGCEAYGVEVNESVRPLAERYGYNVHIGMFDPRMYESCSMDYVTMNQVIEHVADPVATLRDVSLVLKRGGKVVLSVPNTEGWGARLFGRYWLNSHVPYHLQHYSRRSLRIVAEKAGFAVELAKTITKSEWTHHQWLHLVTHPEMGRPSNFWSPDRRLTMKEKILVKTLAGINKTKINHVLTRCFDFLDLGDNNLFILRKL